MGDEIDMVRTFGGSSVSVTRYHVVDEGAHLFEPLDRDFPAHIQTPFTAARGRSLLLHSSV